MSRQLHGRSNWRFHVTTTLPDDRELYDPAVQATDPDSLRRDALAGIAADWSRPWTDPLPFYRDKLTAAGFDPGKMPDLDDIPRTTKPELRADVEAYPPLGTHRSISVAQAIRVGSSTGTTGKPWLILYSPRDLEEWLPVRLRYWWRNGLRPGGRLSHSWPMGLYSTGVLGGRDFLQLRVMEISCGPPATPADVQQHLDVWQALRPTAFMVTGSQLLTYAEAAAERGFDLADLTAGTSLILSEAACQFSGPRQRVEERYGAEVRNISGASEVTGFSLSDCRFHTGLHVPIGHHYVQVCDPVTGREVASGKRGTLVVSSFGLDSYFLRYDLQDIVMTSTEPCPCGETGQRYTYLGRLADVAEVDGRELLPIDVQLALDDFGAPEFRMRAGGQKALSLRVETDDPAAKLAGELAQVLGVPVQIDAVAPGTLPRATFKARRVTA
jgi:phenylacetate-CoA ligase